MSSARREDESRFFGNPLTRRQLIGGTALLAAAPFLDSFARPRSIQAAANNLISEYLDIELSFERFSVTSLEPRITHSGPVLNLKGHHFVPLDKSVPFMQGFTVQNDGQVQMWSLAQRFGGIGNGSDNIGFPISNRWDEDNLSKQAFQRGILIFDSTDGTQDFMRYSFGDNLSPDNSLDSGTDQVQSRVSSSSITLDSIPHVAIVPGFWKIDNLSPDIRVRVGGEGYLLEKWTRAAQVFDKPIWKLIMDAQAEYLAATGRYLPLPSADPSSVWQTWAEQANLDVVDLLQKAFFADAPADGPIEQRATTALNAKRAPDPNLAPVQIHPLLTMAARANCIYGLINYKQFATEGEDIHFPSKNFVGTTGTSATDRVWYWADKDPSTKYSNIDCADVAGGDSLGPEQAIDELWASERHRYWLSQPQKPNLPLYWGYAEGAVCIPTNFSPAEGIREDIGVIGNIF